MRKMKLNLEHLAVESFDTQAAPAKRGTVFGEQCTCYTNCTCPGCPTCEGYATCANADTCWNTCGDQNTCWQTCNSCYWTQCNDSCYNCPTVSAAPCECWL